MGMGKNKEINAVKSQMWSFLMKYGQKANISNLEDYVNQLITAVTQKTAGQRKGDEQKGRIDWDELDMILMSIVIEATALVLSGELDKLKTDEELKNSIKFDSVADKTP